MPRFLHHFERTIWFFVRPILQIVDVVSARFSGHRSISGKKTDSEIGARAFDSLYVRVRVHKSDSFCAKIETSNRVSPVWQQLHICKYYIRRLTSDDKRSKRGNKMKKKTRFTSDNYRISNNCVLHPIDHKSTHKWPARSRGIAQEQRR